MNNSRDEKKKVLEMTGFQKASPSMALHQIYFLKPYFSKNISSEGWLGETSCLSLTNVSAH